MQSIRIEQKHEFSYVIECISHMKQEWKVRVCMVSKLGLYDFAKPTDRNQD
jgi:hypothetical protein